MSSALIFFITSGLAFAAYIIICRVLSLGNVPVYLRTSNELLPVSIIVVCRNEEKYIRSRIEFLLDDNEWISGSELIIVSSGSSDGTNAILREFKSDSRVQLIINDGQWSKIEGVNYAAAKTSNEILVFTDCRQIIASGSIKKMAGHFACSSIGLVAARLCDGSSGAKSSVARRIINFVSETNSRLGYCTNLHGALYALRKSCFKKIPNDIIFDDLFVLASCAVQHKRIVFESDAFIHDHHFQTYYYPERIKRLTRGLLLFITRHWDLINLIPMNQRLHFLIFKYSKLLLPVWLIIFCVLFTADVVSFIQTNSIQQFIGMAFTAALFSFLNYKVFNVLFFAIQTAKGVYAFFIHRDRSVRWEKLKVITN